jgi:hypothetical protein
MQLVCGRWAGRPGWDADQGDPAFGKRSIDDGIGSHEHIVPEDHRAVDLGSGPDVGVVPDHGKGATVFSDAGSGVDPAVGSHDCLFADHDRSPVRQG